MVNKVHHVGNYKDPGALSWVTVFDCLVQTTTSSNGDASLDTGTLTTPTAGTVRPGAVGVQSIDIGAPGTTGLVAGLGFPGAAPSALGASGQLVSTTDTSLTTTLAPATAGDEGLVQSNPAPSLNESVDLATGQGQFAIPEFNPP